MKTFVAAVLSLLPLLLVSTACRQPQVSRTGEGTLYLGAYESSDVVERVVSPGSRKLVLEGHAGAVRLTGSSSDVVRLSITRRARGHSAVEASENLAGLDIIEEGDEISFRYRFAAAKPELSSYDIVGEVPSGTPLVLRWRSGAVDIDGLGDDVDVTTVNGDVNYAGPSTRIRLQSRNGDVRATLMTAAASPADSLRPIPAELVSYEFTTANGGIAVSIPAMLNARIEALTSAGEIRTGDLTFVDEKFVLVNAGAKFTARMGTGNGQVKMSTQNGDVLVQKSIAPPARDQHHSASDSTSAPAPINDSEPEERPASPSTSSDASGSQPRTTDTPPADTLRSSSN